MDISELEQILSKELKHDKRRIGWRRIGWLSKLIQGLYTAKTTNLSKVARAIKHKSKVQSRYRRIQRFFGGFEFEETHMVTHAKIRRLLFVLTRAYAWALKVGIFINQRVKTIPLKKHRRPLYSLFRAGLDFLCEALHIGSDTAIKIAVKVLANKNAPPLRPRQILFLRSFVVY